MNWSLRLYGLALRLYPWNFRQKYGAEMLDVFSQAQLQAGTESLAFLLRELFDLPASILREHFYAFRSGNAGLHPSLAGSTSTGSVSLGPHSSLPPAGWEVLLAGLPHVLLALAMGLLPLIRAVTGSAFHPLDIVIMLALLAAAILALLLTVLRRGRVWAASWFSYWFVAVFMAVLRGHEALFPGRGFEYHMEGFVVNVVFPLIFAFFLYTVARNDRLKGLLAAMPLTLIVWLPYLENTPHTIIDPVAKSLVQLVGWLLLGGAAAYTVRARRLSVSVGLALLPLLLCAPVIVWLAVYQGGVLPFIENGPSLAAVMQFYLRTLWITASLLLGPQLAVSFRAFSRQTAPIALWFYRLAMAGLLLVFIAALEYARLTYFAAGSDFQSEPQPLANALLITGCTLFLFSFALILFTALRQPDWFDVRKLGAYCLLIGLVPVILFIGMPVRMYEPEVPLWLLVPTPLLWIAGSIWLITAKTSR